MKLSSLYSKLTILLTLVVGILLGLSLLLDRPLNAYSVLAPLIAGGVLFAGVHVLILKRVRRLQAQLAELDLARLRRTQPSLQVDLHGNDELGGLAQQINRVVGRLVTTYQYQKRSDAASWQKAQRYADQVQSVNAELNREVAERRRVEERLRNSQDSLRKLADNAFEAIVIHDFDSILTANRTTRQLFGYTAQELEGMNVLNLLASVHHAWIRERWSTGDDSPSQVLACCKNASTFMAELQTQDIRYQGVAAQVISIRDISRQLRAEQRLRVSEHRYRRLLNTTAEGFWMLDDALVTSDVNGALCRMLGYERTEMLGKAFHEFVPEHLQDIVDSQLGNATAGEHNQSVELTLLTRTGQPLYAHINATQLDDGQGVFAFVTDLSRHKALENRLRQNEARLQQAQRMAHLGNWEWDVQAHKLWWSPEAYRILGLDPDQAPPSVRTALRRIAPHDRCRVKRALRHLMQEHRTYTDLEHAIVLENGRQRSVRQSTFLQCDDDGRVLKVQGILQDITEQASQQAELKLAATVFNAASEAVVVTDERFRVIKANPAFCRISGYQPQALRALTADQLARAPESEAALDPWQQVARDGHWQGEAIGVCQDGHRYPIEISLDAVYDGRGRKTHYVGIFEDITERKHYEQRILRQALYDELTGLPNRRLFEDRLQQAITQANRESSCIALLFVDLDKFKAVNDELGHAAGDELLQQVAKRLLTIVRESDTVARLGGDEFTVILPQLHCRADSERVASAMLEALHRPFRLLHQHTVSVSGSIGIALYPDDADSLDSLQERADFAMYRAKHQGRDRVVYHDLSDTSRVEGI